MNRDRNHSLHKTIRTAIRNLQTDGNRLQVASQNYVKFRDVATQPCDRLIVLESMKMEMTIVAHIAGTVIEILCSSGQMVAVGQGLCIIQAPEN